MNRQMRLAAFLYPTGYHVAAWRHPEVPADAGVSLPFYTQLAQLAEAGKFDFVFLPDSVGVRGTDLDALSRTAIRYVAQLEPLTLLAALATATSRIGLAATATTTYNDPYTLARKFASLDHISGGRAAWNMVTSQNPEEALNYGLSAHPEHDERYARGREFTKVVKGLWDSWEDDAFVRDKSSGIFFDPAKMHVLNHVGDYFRVRGPLNVPRTPQGYPVVIQSGSSEAGMQAAAELGEVVFTAQNNPEDAHAFYQDVHSRLGAFGRTSEDVKIFAGVFPFVGRTRSEAEEKFDELQALIDPVVGLSLLSSELGGVDLSEHAVDGPIPDLPVSNGGVSRQSLLMDLAKQERLTIRDLYEHVAGGRGHWQIVGTAKDVADQLQVWFESYAADGFIVMPPLLPGGLVDFVDQVIPELQRRGLFRSEYEGTSLREHLGFVRPSHPATRQEAPTSSVAAPRAAIAWQPGRIP